MIIAPDLISDVVQLARNDIIVVMVDVNELCVGGNEYTILVNIVDGTSIIEKQNATFRDVTFVFDQLSPPW